MRDDLITLKDFKHVYNKHVKEYREQWSYHWSSVINRKTIEALVILLNTKYNIKKPKQIMQKQISTIIKMILKDDFVLLKTAVRESTEKLRFFWSEYSKGSHFKPSHIKMGLDKSQELFNDFNNDIDQIIYGIFSENVSNQSLILENPIIGKVSGDELNENLMVEISELESKLKLGEKEVNESKSEAVELKRRVSNANKMIEDLKSKLENYKISKNNEAELRSFNKDLLAIKKDIAEMINEKYLTSIKRSINKVAFQVLCFGESKFNSLKDVKRYLYDKDYEKTIDKSALKTWEDRIKFISNLKFAKHPSLNQSEEWIFTSQKNNAKYIGTDSYVSFDNTNNIHRAFMFVNDLKWTELKNNNFVLKQKYLRENYEWLIFSNWVNGVKMININLVNSETKEIHEFELIETKEIDDRMKLQSMSLFQALRRLYYDEI